MKSGKIRGILFLTLALEILALQSCRHEPAHLIIAAAANAQYVLKDISSAFTRETGINCDIILNSSGKLTAQIKQGAPYHIFVSADMVYPEELYKAGFTTNKPEVYAFGKLVLWTLDSIEPSIAVLESSLVRHIALANPQSAPYGIAAIETLHHYGVYDILKPKLVFGESIAQANQFIVSKTADIGFTAKSVVLSPELTGQGRWIEIDESSYTPIAQGVVIIKQDVNNRAAWLFYDFLFSEKSKVFFRKYGYMVNP